MGQKPGKESRESKKEGVNQNTQLARKKNVGPDHQKFTIGGKSDQSQLVSLEERQKAQRDLDKMRNKYGLKETPKVDVPPLQDGAQADAPALYALDQKTKKQLREIKNQMREILPNLQVILARGSGKEFKAYLNSQLVFTFRLTASTRTSREVP